MEHVSNVKYILPAEQYIEQLPEYENLSHKSKLRLNLDKIPDLGWKWYERFNSTSVGQMITIDTVYIGTVIKSQAHLSCDCHLIASLMKIPIMSIGH